MNSTGSAINRSKKLLVGEQGEALASLTYHSKGVPLLVSPLLLREMGCGQCDIAYFKKPHEIEVVEVKTQHCPGSKQMKRLKKTCEFLGFVFGVQVNLRVQKTSDCQSEHANLSY